MTSAELINNLKKSMAIRGITIYSLAKLTGIRYELLRRVFNGTRKLTAPELVTILTLSNIKLEELTGG